MTRVTRAMMWFLIGVAFAIGGPLYYLFELDEARRYHNQQEHEPAVFEFHSEIDSREACDYGYENDCLPPWSAFPNPDADKGMPDDMLICPDEDDTCID